MFNDVTRLVGRLEMLEAAKAIAIVVERCLGREIGKLAQTIQDGAEEWTHATCELKQAFEQFKIYLTAHADPP